MQPSTELTVRVHAASTHRPGRRTVHAACPGASRAAGTVAGRFLHLLDDADRERMLRRVRGPARRSPGLGCSPTSPPHRCTYKIGERRAGPAGSRAADLGWRAPHDRSAGGFAVSDLAVTADASRLHLVSLSRRLPVHTMLPSAVDLTVHTHPLARFLLEAPVALAAPCAAFDWGAASALPFLPALRYGRTVLSPARWTAHRRRPAGREARLGPLGRRAHRLGRGRPGCPGTSTRATATGASPWTWPNPRTGRCCAPNSTARARVQAPRRARAG